jgi:hypothetical protein
MGKFSLTELELSQLTNKHLDVTPSFFDSFAKLERICENSQLLMVFDGQIAGLDNSFKNILLIVHSAEILERMMHYREAAFEKIDYWLKSNINLFKKEKSEINEAIRFALRVLAVRSDLFQYVHQPMLLYILTSRVCLNEITSARQQVVLNVFMTALSRGFPDKNIPPIEIVAHDPFRYIGDMLSLVLELAMSEKSFTEQVLADKRGTSKFFQTAFTSRYSLTRNQVWLWSSILKTRHKH